MTLIPMMCSHGNYCSSNALILMMMLVAAGNLITVETCRYQPDNSAHCETIEQSMCQQPQSVFNSTSFPNIYNHLGQAQAENFLRASGLLQLEERLDCSVYARVFICSSVYPLCYERLFQRVEPCREMCVAVRDSCEQRLLEAGMRWPDELGCDMFHPYGTALCIWNDTSTCTPASPSVLPPDVQGPSSAGTSSTSVSSRNSPTCTGHLTPVNNSQASFGGLESCAEPCNGVYFEHDNNTLITVWTTAISFLSLVVSILIFFTFILNIKMVKSLETPIYYIVLCYGCLSLTNLLSIAVGRDVLICDLGTQNSYNQSVLITDGLSSPVCSTLFSLSYFFTLCTWSWWMTLALKWSLCSLRCEKLSKHWEVVFHVIAWGLPFLFLLMVLSMGLFSGNPIVQSCWISKHHEVPFVIVPLAISILFCSVFVLIGYPRVVNLQIKKFKNPTDPATKPQDAVDPSLLLRVGTYITFYLVPMFVLFCAYFYDYWYRVAWEHSYLSCSSSSSSLQSCDQTPLGQKPFVLVYMAQIFASTCMGFVSLFWLLRQKLLPAWRNVCCTLCILGMKRYNFAHRTNGPNLPVVALQPSSQLESGSIQLQMQSATESQV